MIHSHDMGIKTVIQKYQYVPQIILIPAMHIFPFPTFPFPYTIYAFTVPRAICNMILHVTNHGIVYMKRCKVYCSCRLAQSLIRFLLFLQESIIFPHCKLKNICKFMFVYSQGVFDNLKSLVNMVQSRTSYVNRYKNELIFYLTLFSSTF